MKKFTLALIFAASLPGVVQAYCQSSITESSPASRFTTDANGTATDMNTGLTWMRCSLGQTRTGSGCAGKALDINWTQALQLAEGSNFANASNWRLPNIAELKSIIEDRCSYPAINSVIFPATESRSYWSSSLDRGVNFALGSDHDYNKSGKLYLRLVRETP